MRRSTVQNGRQIDLSTQVERVKRKTRPWKSIIALLLAIASAVLSRQARNDSGPFSGTNQTTAHLISAGLAVTFLVFGSIATYSLAGKVRELIHPRVGTGHAAVAGYAILIVGAFTTLVITLVLFGVDVSQLVLGGAITTVFLSIAAQQALGNVFAGLVLVFARPFHVGDAVRLQAGALGGTLDGIVTDIGITYVRFHTDGSVMSIPNSQVLNAMVGPIPPEAEEAEVVADGKSGTPGGPEQPQPRPAGPV
jgi:small-conductance mechanosensitive channel